MAIFGVCAQLYPRVIHQEWCARSAAVISRSNLSPPKLLVNNSFLVHCFSLQFCDTLSVRIFNQGLFFKCVQKKARNCWFHQKCNFPAPADYLKIQCWNICYTIYVIWVIFLRTLWHWSHYGIVSLEKNCATLQLVMWFRFSEQKKFNYRKNLLIALQPNSR